MTALEGAIRERLDGILDPCSVRMGQPRGLVGMGLVEAIVVDERAIRIRLVLTSPGCIYYFQFADSIEAALAPIAQGRSIEVDIDDTILWTAERLQGAKQSVGVAYHRNAHVRGGSDGR